MRRYRPSRPWPVGGLALVAAAGAVLTTATLSSAVDGGPQPAFAARIGEGARSVGSGIAAQAAAPPPPAEGWRIQVGAFRDALAAEGHLQALERDVPRLAGLTATHQLRGGVNRVRIGGIGDEAEARGLCALIAAAGRGCFVVPPEG